MTRDPQLLYMLVNILLLVVVGLVGWLLKRAVTSNDVLVQTAIKELKELSTAVNKLELLMVGDYYPRREHIEYAKHVENLTSGMRENIHDLRDKLQTIMSKVTVLEATVNTLKETKKL